MIILACFLWLLPTVGIFVTSFRERSEILDGGWWTVFSTFKSEEEVVQIYRENWMPIQLDNVLKNTVQTLAPDFDIEPQALNVAFEGALNAHFFPYLLTGKTIDDLSALTAEFANSLNTSRLLADIENLREGERSGSIVGGLVERTFEFDVEDYVRRFDEVAQAPSLSDWERALSVAVSPFTLENYGQVLVDDNMGNSFINSFIITVPGTLLPLLVAAFAAYAFAWMKFPGRTFLFMVVIGLIVVPLQITFIPALRFFVGLGVINNDFFGIDGRFVVLWLAHTGYGLPLLVYMLRNFIGGLPKELFESAFIDGASYTTAFFRLALPLSIPVIASMAIFQFLWVWNDLLVALIYVGGSNATSPVTLTIANMIGSRGEDWHLLTASAFISMIVPLIVFLALQRFFVRGILAGSVKG
jgi:alpha-glucoside transport system permease protein